MIPSMSFICVGSDSHSHFLNQSLKIAGQVNFCGTPITSLLLFLMQDQNMDCLTIKCSQKVPIRMPQSR